MNVLYIIGNGFDKAQGMKTSYPDFYHYLMENTNSGSVLLQQLKKDINADKELWSDMEVAFGKFTSKIETATDLEDLYFELSDNLQEYLKLEDGKFNPSDKLKNKFVADFIYIAKYLGATDQQQFKSYLKTLEAGHDISVMTLNYTDTLEKLLSLGALTEKRINNENF